MKTIDKKIRKNGIATFLGMLAFTFSVLFFATFISNAQPGPRGTKGPGEQVQLLTNYSGNIVRYIPNEDKKFDRLTLHLATGDVTVKFPAHLARQIMNAAKVGSSVVISGFMEWDRSGINEIKLVSMAASNQTILDTPPTPAYPPAAEESITVNGKVTAFKRDREGEINGLYLSDNTIVHFPKHVGYQFATTLNPGDALGVQGFVRAKQDGEVFDGNYRIVEAQVLNINGSSYWVR